MNNLKEQLYQQCVDYVQKRMDAAEQGIKEARQASNEETKSSAGDKYETGRAMMQQETDRNLAQLNEANKLKVILNTISTTGKSEKAEAGSLVITNNGNFYIAISAGILTVNAVSYFAVSPVSPIGLKLKGQVAGNEFSLNGKIYQIKAVL